MKNEQTERTHKTLHRKKVGIRDGKQLNKCVTCDEQKEQPMEAL